MAILSLGLLATACGGDDDGGDLPDATESPFDAAPACTLPSEVVSCGGEGDDGPCQAVCADAYCRDFGMLPTPVCTENCTTPDDCADGWDCNDMGRCRPPDP
jgi:hypothetical protein